MNIGTFIPAIFEDINALVTTLGKVVFPATQVIPKRTFPYLLQIRSDMIIHKASSPPTSQSIIKYLQGGILNYESIFFLLIYIFV